MKIELWIFISVVWILLGYTALLKTEIANREVHYLEKIKYPETNQKKWKPDFTAVAFHLCFGWGLWIAFLISRGLKAITEDW